MSVLITILVAGGFPMGTIPLGCRISEVEYAIGQGATEIDMVIDRALVLTGNYAQLYNELRAIKCACIAGKVTLKTILSVSELGSYQAVYKACMTAMMAGSDFIKTSTGMLDKCYIIHFLVLFMKKL